MSWRKWWLLFAVIPTALTVAGIVITCVGVALVALQPGAERRGAA